MTKDYQLVVIDSLRYDLFIIKIFEINLRVFLNSDILDKTSFGTTIPIIEHYFELNNELCNLL